MDDDKTIAPAPGAATKNLIIAGNVMAPKAETTASRIAELHADRDRRLARLDELVAAGECTAAHAAQRKKQIAEIYQLRERCPECKGPCRKPLSCRGKMG